MADYKYTANADNGARVVALNQHISAKQGIEIGSWLKGKTTSKAKHLLESVLKKEIAVPYKRFKKKMGHRSGPMTTGRYPQKTSELFLKLIKEVEANADVKGLDKNNLVVSAVVVQRGAKNMHQGRQRGRVVKNAHVEIVVSPAKPTKRAVKQAAPKATPKKEAPAPKKETPKVAAKAEPKVEAKPVAKKAEPTEKKAEPKQEAKTEPKPAEKAESESKKSDTQ